MENVTFYSTAQFEQVMRLVQGSSRFTLSQNGTTSLLFGKVNGLL